MKQICSTKLRDYCSQVLHCNGVEKNEADICADVLVKADLRNIPSHGVARLSMYVEAIEKDVTNLNGVLNIIKETPNTLAVDGDGKMGAAVSYDVMNRVIEKAEKHGIGIGCVRNSNHYGIAGYYAMMAAEKDMIGFSMTNSSAFGMPTFGTKVKFGTNPIAFAAPANKEKDFVLDMSTTVITVGKVEVYNREGKTLPNGWAVDNNGQTANNPGLILKGLINNLGGGILPLGGEGETFGGHKGYGLAMMVDILTGVLAGSEFSDKIQDARCTASRVSHFFMAIKIENFRDINQFKADMDELLQGLKNTPPSPGNDRVYYAGLKESEAEDYNLVNGIELLDIVYEDICQLGKKFDLPPLETL